MEKLENYIKMCGEAKEIQDLKPKFKNGDRLANFYTSWKEIDKDTKIREHKFKEVMIWSCLDHLNNRNGVYWLPRQEELIKMLNTSESDIEINIAFGKWCEDWFNNQIGTIWATNEELWLAYIMDQNYNKHWNGETWQKVNQEELK